METRIVKSTAETVYINHPDASYGIFCYNTVGDLFINSDWGMFGYAWRSFGDDFKKFLAGTNSEYLVGKLSINYRDTTGKKLPQHKEEKLTTLVNVFIAHLKSELT